MSVRGPLHTAAPMTLALVAIAAGVLCWLALLGVVLSIAQAAGRADRGTRRGLPQGSTVVVAIVRGGVEVSMRGVVVRDEEAGLELALAELLQADGSTLELDGGAFLEADAIAFVQLVGPSSTFRPKAPTS